MKKYLFFCAIGAYICLIALFLVKNYFKPVVLAQTANTHYVSPTGAATWANCGGATSLNGTSACSWQTAMANAVAGDMVYFRGGDYYPPDSTASPYISLKPSNGGAAGNPITFAAYSGETPNMYQPTGSNSSAVMGVAQKSNYQNNSYIVFDGFTFIKRRHMSAGGVWKCETSDHITVKNNTFIGNDPWQTSNITGASNSPDRIGYSRITIADPINSGAAAGSNKLFVTITGTTDYNGSWTDFTTGGHVYYVNEYNFDIERAYVNSQTGTAVMSDAQNQVGLYNTDCNDSEIYNNIFRDFSYDTITNPKQGYGEVNHGAMWLLGGLRTVVHNNTFLNMPNAIQTKGSANGITSYNNFFNNVKRPFNWVQQWTGIKDFFIYNNVAILPSGGTFVYGAGAVPWANNLVYNNTIYCQGACTGIYQSANMLELKSFNNIIYGVGGTSSFVRYDVGANAPLYSDHNNYYTQGTANWKMAVSAGVYNTNTYTSLGAWNSASGFDINSITANPLFVNAGGVNPGDYKLQSNSPARTGGRGGAYASVMGAYITGNEVIGYTAPSSPAPLKGDFNSDSKVNNLDFTAFKNALKSLFNSLFDLNSDNTIDVKDLGVLMSSWLP